MTMLRMMVCVLVVLFLAAGCGRKKEETKVAWPEDPEIAEAQEELANVKPDAGDEKSLQVAGDYGAKVPPHFPEDVPLPDDLTVTGAHEIQGRFSMKFTASSAVREVAEAFVKNLQGKGWKLAAPEISGKEAFVSGEKDDRMVSVVITRAGMGCEVELDVPGVTVID